MKDIKRVKHIKTLKSLNLPFDEVLIVGSGTMSLYGLKRNDDLDLWVTKRVYNILKNHPEFFYNGKRLQNKDKTIEADFKLVCAKKPLSYYLERAVVIDGFHFMSLEDVIEWKKCMKRKKDLEHIKIIEDYLDRIQKKES